MRLFVAIDLGDSAREAIAAEQRRIGSTMSEGRSSLKWVRPDHIHLTLAFLGEVPDAKVPAIVDAMAKPFEQHAPFEIGIGGAGMFPPHGAPRVFWLGVSNGEREVIDVQRAVAERLRGLGVTLEDRAFHPHLTLARWRESRSADRHRVERAARDTEIARAPVSEVTLFQSRLSSSGPTYTALARAPLV